MSEQKKDALVTVRRSGLDNIRKQRDERDERWRADRAALTEHRDYLLGVLSEIWKQSSGWTNDSTIARGKRLSKIWRMADAALAKSDAEDPSFAELLVAKTRGVGQGSITLVIGKRHKSHHATIVDAQAKYCELRDESGEGASTWPDGRISDPTHQILRVSYNGRLWDGDKEFLP